MSALLPLLSSVGNYSFKSSGTTQADSLANTLAKTALPIGIKTPLALGSDDIVVTNTSLAEQVTDNLRNLILTNWGERLGFYDFGANLRPLTTELVSLDDFDSEAINRIKTATQRWMPYIDLQDFISTIDRTQNKNTAVIQVTITFDIPNLGVKNKKLQISLYAI